jgi:hypothetical protein
VEQGRFPLGSCLPNELARLAAALDGLLFHRLVDATLEVGRAAGPLEAMLGRPGATPSRP